MSKKKLNVGYLAQLVNLPLGKKEKGVLGKQLQDSVGYIEVLEELKTDNITSVNQVTSLKNVSRKDEVGKSLTQEEALGGARKKKKGYFVTKRVKWE